MACVALLIGLSLYAVHLSGIPRPLAGLAMVSILGYGLQHVRREWRIPAHRLVIPKDASSPIRIDDMSVSDVQMHWRGPLAFLRVRTHQGLEYRLTGWPDNLPAPLRRELRLALDFRNASRRRR